MLINQEENNNMSTNDQYTYVYSQTTPGSSTWTSSQTSAPQTAIYTTSNPSYTFYNSGNSALNANDIILNGKSLAKLLESIEDRLAILIDPDPAKLEKYAALKKAYDNYKLLEKLINEE